MREKNVDVAIIGAGSAGLYALSKVRPSGKSFVLINGGETGTTCARVGCMPSKALLQMAEDIHRRKVLKRYGVSGYDNLAWDNEEAMEYVQDMRDSFVERVRSHSTDKMDDEHFIEGYARFIDPHRLEVNGQHVVAEKIIIATGSRPLIPDSWSHFGDRILTTDTLFELTQLPDSLAVIGLGAIGLEIGQALSRLGVSVTGFDLLNTIGGLDDPVVTKMAADILGKEFPLHLGVAASVSATDSLLQVTAGEQQVEVDAVLASLGRIPNIDGLALENAGIELDPQGIPVFNPNTMRAGQSHIFMAGDVNNYRPLLHEAADEGRVAGFNALSDTITPFERKTPFGIIFCDPNIVQVGTRWSDLDPETTATGKVQFGPVGRAMIMAKNRGCLHVYADKNSGRLLGAQMICAKGENLAHLLAWSIQQKLTVHDLLKMPYYHPVIEEALQAALYNLNGEIKSPEGEKMVEHRTLP